MKEIYYPVKRLRFAKSCLFFVFNAAFALSLQAQTVYYVKPGASGSGASWGAAGDLQTIVNAAPAGSQVWVAAGTYYPNAYPSGSTGGTTNRDYAFTLKTGVAIYGGFAGTETLLSQRNYTTNVTILSGDVGTIGTYTDDCYHVVISVGNTSTAVLDGFTIKYGYASGSTNITYAGQTIVPTYGGALHCYNSSPVINNCVFSNNVSTNFGGAMYCYTSAPALENCSFSSNQSASGGAIYNRNSGTPPVLGNCTFTSNTATSGADGGGAVYTYSSSAITFDTCTFSGNKATGQDGGVLFAASSSSNSVFNDCTLSSNTAAANGGAIYVNSGTVVLNACTLTSNVAANSGGAVYTTTSSVLTATNTSFTSNLANSATLGGGAIYTYSTGGSSATNCTFTSNTAVTYGGGYFGNNGAGGLIMSHCVFASNAAVYGAGMANLNGSAPTVNNCQFSNGSATYGGAVYTNGGSAIYSVDSFFNNTATATSGMAGGGVVNDGANCTYSHCWFHGNVTNGGDGAGQYDNGSAAPVDSSCVFEANIAKGATSNGGGLYHNSSGTAKIENCVFVDNGCKTNGGGYYNNASSSTIENCTFYNNTAAAGAGIYDPGGGNTKYYANMVWGNSPDGFALGAGSTGGFKVKYNNFQAGYTGGGSYTNNTFTAPAFYNSGSYTGGDGKWATADDGLHLAAGSVGADAVLISAGLSMPDDITIAPRPDIGGELNVDEGAYEGPGALLLAMQLMNFTAVPAAPGAVFLQWQVNAAAQASTYEVQKSLNGADFTPLVTLSAVAVESIYQFTDAAADQSRIYYRIRLTGSDGTISYSPVDVINETTTPVRFALRPSVVTGQTLHLFIGNETPASTVAITVTDASGRLLLRSSMPVSQGDNNLPVQLGQVVKGIYYLHIMQPGGIEKILPFEKL